MPGRGGAVRSQSRGDGPQGRLTHDCSRRDTRLSFTVAPMRFDSKIAMVVRDDLATWQKLNVACFLTGGLVGSYPALAGARYIDASGRSYGPLIRQPILIFAASADELKRALQRASERA